MNSKSRKINIIDIVLYLFIIALFIFRDIKIGPINFQLTEIFAMILIFLYFVNILASQKISNYILAIKVFSLLFILFAVLSSTQANDSMASFKGVIKWTFGLLIMFALTTIVNNEERFLSTIKVFVIVGTLLNAIALIMLPIAGSISQSGMGVAGFHSNQWGQFSMTIIILNVTLLLNGHKKKFYLLSLAINVLVLVLTFSMACWVFTAISIAFIFIKTAKKQNLIKKISNILLIGIPVGGSLGFLIIWFFNKYLSSRIGHLVLAFSNPLAYKTVQQRFSLWERTIELAQSEKYGVGLYNLVYYLPNNHAHNTFFEILGSMGFIGLFIFILLMSALFITATIILFKKSEIFHYQIGLVAVCFSYFSANLLSDSFGPRTHFIFWIFLGLLFASNKYNLKLSARSN